LYTTFRAAGTARSTTTSATAATTPRAQLTGLLESAGFAVEQARAARFPFFNLYRMLVTLRGEALIAEAAHAPSLLMRSAGSIFNALFHLNLMHPWGWQTVAVARYRGK
jgi:hypothetical protein